MLTLPVVHNDPMPYTAPTVKYLLIITDYLIVINM